jgi:hypothetical protein
MLLTPTPTSKEKLEAFSGGAARQPTDYLMDPFGDRLRAGLESDRVNMSYLLRFREGNARKKLDTP